MGIIAKLQDKVRRNAHIYAEAWRQGRIAGMSYTWLLWKNHTKFLLHHWSIDDKQKAIRRLATFMERFAYVTDKYKDEPAYPAPYNPKESTTIWVYWNDESFLPPMVASCVHRIQENANGREVVIITDQNVSDYLDFDQIVWKKQKEGKITRTHFSDFIRMGVLLKYGGVYIDSTTFLTQPLPAFVTESAYYTNHVEKIDGTNIGGGRWSSFFQACHKNCLLPRVVLDIFTEYWKHYDALVDYVLIDYAMNLAYEHVPAIRKLIDAVPYNNPDIWIQQLNIAKPFTQEQFDAILADKTRFMWKFSYKASADAPVRDAQGRITLKGRICGLK